MGHFSGKPGFDLHHDDAHRSEVEPRVPHWDTLLANREPKQEFVKQSLSNPGPGLTREMKTAKREAWLW